MIPELGHFALILGLCMALVLAFFPLVGSLTNTPSWVALARPLAWGQFLFIAIAFLALVQSFLSNDFSVLYVAQNGNTQLPTRWRRWSIPRWVPCHPSTSGTKRGIDRLSSTASASRRRARA